MSNFLEQKKIIVGILDKDCAQQLKQCLHSLLNQEFKNFEVVVVDGGSKDDSLCVLQDYSKRDERVHYFIQKSKGTGMARNELIEYVKENFPECSKIVWGDAENVYDPKYLENIVAKSKGFSVVGGKNVIDSRNPLAQALWWYYNDLLEGVSGNNECVDIEIYKTHKYTDVVRGEDYIFHRQLVMEGHKLYKCSQAVCYIKTVESFNDFINWTRKKALGLFQWAYNEKMIMSLIKHYLFFNMFIWTYILFFFVLILFSPFLLVLYFAFPIMLSFYFWQKGKSFVRDMRKVTFFYFIPVLSMHFSVTLFELLKLRLFKR
jgi:glycosyltransferase involved in cell wall biosynthesis